MVKVKVYRHEWEDWFTTHLDIPKDDSIFIDIPEDQYKDLCDTTKTTIEEARQFASDILSKHL